MRGPEGLSSDPLVTVVTPTLERRERLAHTLKSVAFQTYPNIEHIVVDGGSTDGTRQMLEEWEREQGVRWISEPDEGIYDAVNKGFDMANGTVFCYLNSDDLFFPWSVAVAVDALRSVDLIYGDAVILREELGALQFALARPDLACRPELSTIRQPAAFWTRALHESLRDFRGDKYSLRADHDFWIRAIEAGFKLRKMREALAAIGDHAGTANRVAQDQMTVERQALREEWTHGRFGHGGTAWMVTNRLKLLYRRELLGIVWNSALPQPRNWVHFIRHLRTKGLTVNLPGTLFSLIPMRWWPQLGGPWPNIGDRSFYSSGALLDFVSGPREDAG